jgi:hypothetical protein
VLVLGVQDPRRLSVNQTKFNKQQNADHYQIKGYPIEIIDEIEFLRALETHELLIFLAPPPRRTHRRHRRT